MRSLIVNADDFGYNDDTFDATVSCFEGGLLTSATILAGMPASALAYDYAKQNRKRFSFGLHLNLAEGRPLSGHRRSLCHSDGTFRNERAQRFRGMFGLLWERDIRTEFRHQLTELLDHGVKVSHVDGHFHLHKLPFVIRAIKKEMQHFGIHWVRRPQNLYPDKQRRGAMNKLLLQQFRGLRYPDYYIGADTRGTDWHQRIPDVLPAGVTEISIHPGYRVPWRKKEAEPFLQPDELRKCLARHGIALRRHGAV